MLTDAQWAVLEPLIEAVRPEAKVPPQHLRHTISAILWRHDNGAKWRAVPAELGPWWMAAQTALVAALLRLGLHRGQRRLDPKRLQAVQNFLGNDAIDPQAWFKTGSQVKAG